MPWGGRSLHSFHSLVTALHCPVITLGAGEGLLGLLSLFLATAGHDGTLHDCFAPQGFRGYTGAASFFRLFTENVSLLLFFLNFILILVGGGGIVILKYSDTQIQRPGARGWSCRNLHGGAGPMNDERQ